MDDSQNAVADAGHEHGVWLVVPCYNERSVIRNTAAELAGLGWNVLVVDDGSQDGSRESLRGLPIVVARHIRNLGQGAALRTGTLLALRLGAKYIVHFDADGQHDPRYIDDMLAPLRAGEADIAIGSRFLRESDTMAIPSRRRALLRVAVWVNWALTGVRLSDAHNGFRAMSRRAAEMLVFRERRMAHATEIVHLIRVHSLRVREIAMRVRYTDYSRAKGQSAMGALHVLWDYLRSRIL